MRGKNFSTQETPAPSLQVTNLKFVTVLSLNPWARHLIEKNSASLQVLYVLNRNIFVKLFHRRKKIKKSFRHNCPLFNAVLIPNIESLSFKK